MTKWAPRCDGGRVAVTAIADVGPPTEFVVGRHGQTVWALPVTTNLGQSHELGPFESSDAAAAYLDRAFPVDEIEDGEG